MDKNQFIKSVARLASISPSERAEEIVSTTLTVLGQRLNQRERTQLSSHLPEELGQYLQQSEDQGEPFTLEQFFGRIQDQSDEKYPNLVHEVRAVCEMVSESVPPKALADVTALLPPEFRQLFDAGPPIGESRSELSV